MKRFSAKHVTFLEIIRKLAIFLILDHCYFFHNGVIVKFEIRLILTINIT